MKHKNKPDKLEQGQLAVGATSSGMVYFQIPIKTPGDILFTVEQARHLAEQLLEHSKYAEKARAGGRGAYHA